MRQAAGGYETGGADAAGRAGHVPCLEEPAGRASALRSVISGLLRRVLAFRYSWQSVLWPPAPEMTLYGGAHGWPQLTGAARPRARGGNGRPEGRDFVLIPGVRHPRLLVPAVPRAAAAALRQYGQPRSWPARMGVAAFALGLASGLGGTLLGVRVRVTAPPEAESVESYLKSVLSPDIRVSIRLGPARANRKPGSGRLGQDRVQRPHP